MRRLLFILSFLVLILLTSFSIAVYNAEFLLSTTLTKELGVPVSVKKITYKNSLLTISDILVGSPNNAKIPYSLKIGSIQVSAPATNYLKKTIFLKKVVIDTIDMNIEFYSSDYSNGNWSTILANLKSSSADQTSRRNANIDLLLLNNLNFKLLTPAQKQPSTLPPLKTLQFKNLQTANGDLTASISQAILNHLVQAVFWKNAIPSALSLPIDASSNAVNNTFETIKNIFNFN
ncbi:MAG: hypothetical protein FJZ56_02615 [Chlamydiae bacterium]|nr:hypothetical protein [Chlamydiota bacterium]